MAVLNTLGASEEDNIVVNDTAIFQKESVPAQVLNQQLKGDKSVYGLREKVTLSWPSQLADARELTLSVVRQDCEVKMSQPSVASPVPAEGGHWTA